MEQCGLPAPSDTYVGKAFVDTVGLLYREEMQRPEAQLPDGNQTTGCCLLGVTKGKITFGAFFKSVSGKVLESSVPFDKILGDAWLKRRQAVRKFRSKMIDLCWLTDCHTNYPNILSTPVEIKTNSPLENYK